MVTHGPNELTGQNFSLTRTNANLLSLRPRGTYFSKILFEIKKFHFQENTLENAVCKLSSVLFLGVNVLRVYRADSRLAPSQWETLLPSNVVSHWLGASLGSALSPDQGCTKLKSAWGLNFKINFRPDFHAFSCCLVKPKMFILFWVVYIGLKI